VNCEDCGGEVSKDDCMVSDLAVGPLYYCREHCPRCNIGE